MEIMNKVTCPYCKEWLDIESFITLDDLKNEFVYKECYLCNKWFALLIETNIKAKEDTLEKCIKDRKRTIQFYKNMIDIHETAPVDSLERSIKYYKSELERLYKMQKENNEK